MSVREEDKRKTSNTSRGLGLAAAAVGVGVGAALYYYLTKREDPEQEGPATSNWNRDEPQPLSLHENYFHRAANMSDSESEYSTVSEHTTTDSSVYYSSNSSSYSSIHDSSNTPSTEHSSIHTSSEYTSATISDIESTDNDEDILDEFDESAENVSTEEHMVRMSREVTIRKYLTVTTQTEREIGNNSMADSSMEETTIDTELSSMEETTINTEPRGSDTDREWDITSNSQDVPRITTEPRLSPMRQLMYNVQTFITPKRNRPRHRVRERSWSLEECSICCDIMLKDQHLARLPCSHNFHAKCVAPWLREHQTCPNCRKEA